MVEPAEREQLAKVLRAVATRHLEREHGIDGQATESEEAEALRVAKAELRDIMKRIDYDEILSLPPDDKKKDDDKKITKKKKATRADSEAASAAAADWAKRRKSAK